MRPLRLELQGFASFRERTVVEFDDETDLFVLTGPTGSGKSSVIDAMTFALYGSVPRYDHKGIVEPVITKGQLEAKVRLDFSVGGEAYTAVRVVRRSGNGATTKEARLETAGRSLAANAKELTERVEQLLGLTFEHFTKCVVLPQGDFARLLHDGHKERLELLVKLLGVEFLREVMRLANQRADVARSKAAMCQQRLDEELAGATREALDDANARVAALRDLLAAIEADAPRLEALALRGQEAARTAKDAAEAAAVLGGVRSPDGVGELAGRVRDAQAEVARALDLVETAGDALDGARAAREELPWNVARLEALEQAYRDLDRVVRSRESAATALDDAIAAEGEAEAARAAAAEALRAATERREAVLNENYAYRLSLKLQPGDPCPVCGEALAAAPQHEPPPGMKDADTARAAAEAALAEAEKAAQRARGARSQRQAELSERTKQIVQLEDRLEGQPPPGELADLRAKVEAAERAVHEAEANARKAGQLHRAALAGLEAAQQASEKGWAAFDRAYAAAAPFGPPPPERADLSAAWAALVGWARAELPAREAAAATAREAAGAAAAERESVLAAQRERCRAAGVDAARESPRDACRDALSRGQAAVERIEEQIATAAAVRRELAEQTDAAAIAATLAQCLRGDRTGFQEWYVDRVLRRLVRDASHRLEQLSSNQYALVLDANREFAVVDHTNADELRPVRTLSGGETFLASLSLALALSDNLVDMAANGAARLEAIFLDEGFGTLDPDTLDTVAAALEELGARGRMVGVVTHVQALAERLPVRFEVRKEGRTSKVERVVS